MKRLLATTAVALCLGATAANAEMTTLAEAGYWTASAGRTSDTD
jgi:hypothetical protein